jgi:hypothetical protein
MTATNPHGRALPPVLVIAGQDARLPRIEAGLRLRGLEPVRLDLAQFPRPPALAWRVDEPAGTSTIRVGDRVIAGNDLAGVLLLDVWSRGHAAAPDDDASYAAQETTALMRGWLAALPCPVINALPSERWHQRFLGWMDFGALPLRAPLRPVRHCFGNSAAALAGMSGPPGSQTLYQPFTSGRCDLAPPERVIQALAAFAPVRLWVWPAGPLCWAVVCGDQAWMRREEAPQYRDVTGDEPGRALVALRRELGVRWLELAMIEAADGYHCVQGVLQPWLAWWPDADVDRFAGVLAGALARAGEVHHALAA